MQCPFCKVDVGNQDELQLHCLVCTTAYAGSYKCMFVTKRLIFLMVLVDETVLIHSSDDNLSEENLFLQAFFGVTQSQGRYQLNPVWIVLSFVFVG